MNDLQAQAKEAADMLQRGAFIYKTFIPIIDLLRRIERGELVEVVRCGACVHSGDRNICELTKQKDSVRGTYCFIMDDNEFCSSGRRKSDANG